MDILASAPPVVSVPSPVIRPTVVADFNPAAAVAAVKKTVNDAPAAEASAPSRDQVDQAVARLNKAVQKFSSGIEFSVDSDNDDRVVVKIVDQATKEVIRQMPTKEALEISKAIDRSIGLLIRQKG
jgi:flagellar protein FlaG